jgi:hypothetical protein
MDAYEIGARVCRACGTLFAAQCLILAAGAQTGAFNPNDAYPLRTADQSGAIFLAACWARARRSFMRCISDRISIAAEALRHFVEAYVTAADNRRHAKRVIRLHAPLWCELVFVIPRPEQELWTPMPPVPPGALSVRPQNACRIATTVAQCNVFCPISPAA